MLPSINLSQLPYKHPAREFRVNTSSMEDRACEVQDTIALFDDVQKHLTDEHTAREVKHLQLPRINSCITSRIYKRVSDSWNKFAVKRTLHYSLFINALHRKVGKYNLFCRGAYTVEYSLIFRSKAQRVRNVKK